MITEKKNIAATAPAPSQIDLDPYAQNLQAQTTYLKPDQQQQILKAYDFAKTAHSGQYRRTGEPYVSHPVSVSLILAAMQMDTESLIAALLHDVIEDCAISKQDIETEFGKTVADLVDGVSKISALQIAPQKIQQAENFRKMVLAMTRDIRVILVKLADRLHNMRTLSVLNPEKRRRIATETLEIYAPIANRLGMNNIRVEFEDLGFSALYPMRSRLIKKAVKHSRGNRKEVMRNIESAITHRLNEEKLSAHLVSREKHLYSIYQKMKTQHKSFTQIMDVYGFRIIVDSVDSCYRTLGVLHNLYTPIPGRFKDYIAIPKANGYQSLHSTLKGANGVPIEIQIRTEDMEAMANNGISAHWLYKSDSQNESHQDPQSRTQAWLKGLLELQKNTGNSLEFIENVKIDLFPDEVYVFTPKGNIFELPSGATAVDFAYAIHTDVGNTCVAARIDHHLAPLSTPLQSGQTIEIITASSTRPNPSWLDFVITGKARANIRNFLKNQRRTESVTLGHRLLDKSLTSLQTHWDSIPAATKHQAAILSGFNNIEDLLEDIGLGNRVALLVARQLLHNNEPPAHATSTDKTKSTHSLTIQGTEGMVLHFSKCCRPIPGDAVVGFLSAGRGLMIHMQNCRNIAHELKENPEKCLLVRWDHDITGEYSASLRVHIENKRGALASLATRVAGSGANIQTIHMDEKDGTVSVVDLLIGVKDRTHLAHIIKRLRTTVSVIKITRTKG